MNIQDPIAETLMITLYMRARQSQAKNPIITDPDAVRLVEQIDYDFKKFDGKIGSQVGTALRARYLDDKARAFFEQYPNAVGVNVGCGLDTRWQRLADVVKQAHLYSLDIDESMALRQRYLPALNNETYLTASMLDDEWLSKLVDQHPNTPMIFIIEGVFMYFKTQQVKVFMVNLANHLTDAQVHFDVIGSFTYNHQHRHDTVGQMRANFKSYIDDPMMMSQWHDRLQYVGHCYFGDLPEAGRMVRFWLLPLIKFVPAFRKSCMFVSYQIGD